MKNHTKTLHNSKLHFRKNPSKSRALNRSKLSEYVSRKYEKNIENVAPTYDSVPPAQTKNPPRDSSSLLENLYNGLEKLSNLPLSKSFVHGNAEKREIRSHSQISKIRPNKSNHEIKKPCVKISMKNTKTLLSSKINTIDTCQKKTSITSCLNNPKTSNIKYITQTVDGTKRSSPSNKFSKKIVTSNDYREMAIELEKKLKDELKQGDVFDIHCSLFNEIIRTDPYFGYLLKQIQRVYEDKYIELKNLVKSLIEGSKEQNTRMKSIYKNFITRNNNQPETINEKVKKVAKIPRLNLSKMQAELETEEMDLESNIEEPMDYNDEFMSRADFFSQSWKDALAKEKRY